ncbi:DUF3429 domain-containing protein [Mangrovitalea sediminis]|uniref:DUF3429 domain-containing protein n=1 Tax=Mangrovitalea sediminis TaxID=1982043 RepID=UPI000BE5B23A|nr:DUF3429 domain-containing protein [Mangrovitalea sediminis]
MLATQRLAVAVGLAGLIPFLAGPPALLLWPECTQIVPLFYLYAAGILAFMAGIYWAISMQVEDRAYPISPLVSLLLSQGFFIVAGLGLLAPQSMRTGVFPLAYIALYIVDHRLLDSYWPHWYLRLRGGLTLVAVLCLLGFGLVEGFLGVPSLALL